MDDSSKLLLTVLVLLGLNLVLLWAWAIWFSSVLCNVDEALDDVYDKVRALRDDQLDHRQASHSTDEALARDYHELLAHTRRLATRLRAAAARHEDETTQYLADFEVWCEEQAGPLSEPLGVFAGEFDGALPKRCEVESPQPAA